MTKHATNEDLRAALESAMVGMTEEQARAARTLLDALTPPMEEPVWPGAPVIARCSGTNNVGLHIRRDSKVSRWECALYCTSVPWGNLVNQRPLTPAEYAEHGIPQPCDHVADEETVKRAMRAFYANAVVIRSAAMRAALIAAGFKAAE